MKAPKILRGFLLLCAFAALSLVLPANAQSVGVTVDGQPASLNPAPLERAGRIFVPLRGVFEKLGASVVYENGRINATGNNRSISLQIGSTQASVNGQMQSVDVAPFIVGASTYVPLRFVAQALGASVNWDGANRVVALGTNGSAAPPQNYQPQAPAKSGLRLDSREPAIGASVRSNRPTISARFSGERADPNTLKITLDQLDITGSTSRSPNGIVYSPQSDLQPMRHIVRITGKDAQGLPFDLRWSFGSGTVAQENVISDVSPANGANVGSSFTVRGRTLPGSHVTVEVGAGASVGGLLAFGTGTFRGDTTADANGNFTEDVNLNTVPGGYVNIVVSSTAPGTGAAAPQIKRSFSVKN
jgi:hypothetical protein